MTIYMYTQKYIHGHTHSYRYVIYNNLLRKIEIKKKRKKEKVKTGSCLCCLGDMESGPYDDILGMCVSHEGFSKGVIERTPFKT